MEPVAAESCVQFLNRNSGGSRPSLENVNREIFPEGLLPGIVEISGEENCGKSVMTFELIANALVPKEFGGCESNVLLISTENKFMITLFMEILRKRTTNENATLCLENFHIMKCFDPVEFEITLQKLPEILSANSKISLVVLDSAVTFYWFEAEKKSDNTSLGRDEYLASILRKFQVFTEEFNISFLFTRPAHFKSNKNYKKFKNFQYQIELSRVDENCYLMKTFSKKSSCLKIFKITSRGIFFGTDSHEAGDTEMLGIPDELFQKSPDDVDEEERQDTEDIFADFPMEFNNFN